MFWGISLAVGWLQGIRPYIKDVPRALAIVAESVVRTSIVLTMYGAVKVGAEGAPRTLAGLLAEPRDVFIAVTVPLLGVAIGLANLTVDDYVRLLRTTSLRLRTYSEWLLGPELLRRSIADASALQLTRVQRAVLFMDVRGFTAWSEAQRPEAIVPVLELIYTTAERILDRHEPLKVKLSADEVMAVFPDVDRALRAAGALRTRIGPLLAREGMSVGIGIHAGDVVEGLMGAERTRVYDVIGDTVNTAKRIEQEAGPGEILVSATARDAAGPGFEMVEARSVQVKGKDAPLTLYRLRANRLAVDRSSEG